jgi:hypothetical protein
VDEHVFGFDELRAALIAMGEGRHFAKIGIRF